MPVLKSPTPVAGDTVYASVCTSTSAQPSLQHVPSVFMTFSISMCPNVPVSGGRSKSSSRTSSRERTAPGGSGRGNVLMLFPLTSTYVRRSSRSAPDVFVSVTRVLQKGFEPSSRGAPPAWTVGNDNGGGWPPSGRLESAARAGPVFRPATALGRGWSPLFVTPTWSEESCVRLSMTVAIPTTEPFVPPTGSAALLSSHVIWAYA